MTVSTQFLAQQNRLLEMITRGLSLPIVLDGIAQFVEQEIDGVVCSFLRLNSDETALDCISAPSLPASFKRVTSIQIGHTTCGRAVVLRNRVITADILGDPYWHEYQNWAVRYELRACWAMPIFANHDGVAGVCALFARHPRLPTEEEISLLEMATQLASLAIERQTSENALRNSQQFMRKVADTFPGVVYIYDLQEQRSIYVNLKIETLGYDIDQMRLMQEQFLSTLVHPDDRLRLIQHFQSFTDAREGVTLGLEYRVRAANGEWHWFYSQTTIFIPLPDGRPKQVVGVAIDITDRKHLEESLQQANTELDTKVRTQTTELADTIACLREEILTRKKTQSELWASEERYRSMVAALQEGVMLYRDNGNVYACNTSAERILGLSAEQISGREPLAPNWYFVQEDGSRFPEENHPALMSLRSGQPCSNQILGIHKPSGIVTWISVNAEPLFRVGETHPYSVVTSFADITARKRTEAALRKSERELRALLAAMTDVILVLDKDGRYLKVPPTNPDLMHLPAAELIGKTVNEVIPAEAAALCLRAIHQALETQQPVRTEYSQTIGQREVWFSANISPLSEDSVVWVARDISDRKRAEIETLNALSQEKELNELKSRFVSMISHEFRTPLTTIQSAAELLEYYQWSADQRRDRFQQIHSAVQHMTQLLEDVLILGRADAGKLHFDPHPQDLTQFCQDLMADLHLMSGAYQRIHFAVHGHSQLVRFDPKLLRQILTNLLSNAVKYSPTGGNIWLRVIYHTDWVALQVKDQGIGIPEEEQPRLFEAFYRATNVETMQGTGLGLTIVKRCVDLHQGQISVSSILGAGTTFTVLLPIHYQLSALASPNDSFTDASAVKGAIAPAASSQGPGSYPVLHPVTSSSGNGSGITESATRIIPTVDTEAETTPAPTGHRSPPVPSNSVSSSASTNRNLCQ